MACLAGKRHITRESRGKSRSARILTLFRLALDMEELGVLQSLRFRSLCSALFFRFVVRTLGGRNNQQIDVFNEDLDGLISEVHPMEGQRELPQMTCRRGR